MPSILPIFDLDDTLYPERTFVTSGFRTVAGMLAERFRWDQEEVLGTMLETLRESGRGGVFDALLKQRDRFSAKLVKECIRAYRHHNPAISLFPEAESILASLTTPAYLVTDGHKIVQANKVAALGLHERFKRVFITHRFGRVHAKPSTHCFELIRKMEGCDWGDLAYIGDNPAKDFVNLTPLGVRTIRVRTGEHRQVEAAPGFDARFSIASLRELPPLLVRG